MNLKKAVKRRFPQLTEIAHKEISELAAEYAVYLCERQRTVTTIEILKGFESGVFDDHQIEVIVERGLHSKIVKSRDSKE